MLTIDVAISIELQRIGVGTLKLRYRDLPHYNKMFDVGVIKFYNRYGPRELCLWFVELAITYGDFIILIHRMSDTCQEGTWKPPESSISDCIA